MHILTNRVWVYAPERRTFPLNWMGPVPDVIGQAAIAEGAAAEVGTDGRPARAKPKPDKAAADARVATDDDLRKALDAARADPANLTQDGKVKIDPLNAELAKGGFDPVTAERRDSLPLL